jgi:hypothetical protein
MPPIHALFAFDPSIDHDRFVRDCKDWGIDTPILHGGFFRDGAMLQALARERLDLWLNVPVFYDPAYLERHPDAYAITNLGRRAVHDWLHFVCPSQDAYLDALVKDLRGLLARLRPTVVSLDFIRHFVFWEGVRLDGPPEAIEDGCYCPTCLRRFEEASGERVDRSDPARDLRGRLRPRWADWKCRRIADVAERLFVEIRDLADGARLAIKTVPWGGADLEGAIRWSAGQDLGQLTRGVDLVTPMAFTHILGQTPEWKRRLLRDVQSSTGKPILSYLQVDKVYRAEEISTAELEAELQEASSSDHAGIVVFHYDQLVANPEKARLLRARLNAQRA